MEAKTKFKKFSLKKGAKKLLKGKNNPNWKKTGVKKCLSLAPKNRGLNLHYQSGRRYEYKTTRELKKIGFQIVIRSARSRGIFDIFAIKGNNKTRKVEEIRCIQVKSTASNFPVRSIFSEDEMREIINNKAVPIIARNIFYEIWLWRKRKEKEIYRLNWERKKFEKYEGA